MAITERIKRVLDKHNKEVDTDPRKLGEFLEELKNNGLVVKKEYDLPPLDTVGRRIYRENSKVSC